MIAPATGCTTRSQNVPASSRGSTDRKSTCSRSAKRIAAESRCGESNAQSASGEAQPVAGGALQSLTHGVVLAEPAGLQVFHVQGGQPRVTRRQLVDDRAGAVIATVVDHDELQPGIVLRQQAFDAAPDVLLFVLGGDEHGQRRKLIRINARLIRTQDRLVAAFVEIDVPLEPDQPDQAGDPEPDGRGSALECGTDHRR